MARPSTIAAGLSGLMWLPAILTGGDHFLWWRHYQPVYPTLLVAMFCAVRDYGPRDSDQRYGWAPRAAVAGVLLLFSYRYLPGQHDWRELPNFQPIGHEFAITEANMRYGVALREAFSSLSALPSMGVISAGAIKRSYGGPIVDLMGLNSVAMGHSPGERRGLKGHTAFSKSVFCALRPDLMCPDPLIRKIATGIRIDCEIKSGGFQVDALKGITNDPQFASAYPLVTLRRPVAGREQILITAFFRRDALEHFKSHGYDVVTANLL